MPIGIGQRTDTERLAEHLASRVRFGLGDRDGMRVVHDMTKDLRDLPTAVLLEIGLARVMSFLRADFGNIQLCDAATDALRIAAHDGFNSEFLDYFEVVDDTSTACGRAAHRGGQTVIADVSIDPAFALHRDIAAASGFRAVQSTPLIDYSGNLVGIISTHFRSPHEPVDRDMEIVAGFAAFLGEAVSTNLVCSASDPVQRISRAVMSALFDLPVTPQQQADNLWFGEITGSHRHEMNETYLLHVIVQRIFSASLSLASGQARTFDPVARDRLSVAIDELDSVIRDVRKAVFGPA
jgi:hypothetical protein